MSTEWWINDHWRIVNCLFFYAPLWEHFGKTNGVVTRRKNYAFTLTRKKCTRAQLWHNNVTKNFLYCWHPNEVESSIKPLCYISFRYWNTKYKGSVGDLGSWIYEKQLCGLKRLLLFSKSEGHEFKTACGTLFKVVALNYCGSVFLI